MQIPYIYSLGRRIETEGYTLQRHLAFDFPDDPKARASSESEFMFGDALLVAPVVSAADHAAAARSVYIPDNFVDFYDGTAVSAGTTVDAAKAPSSRIPVYGRAGSMVPLAPFGMQSVGDAAAVDPLEVRIYGGDRDANFTLYEDNGVDRSYLDGAGTTIEFFYDSAASTFTAASRQGSFDGMLDSRTIKVVLVGEGHGVGIGETASPDASFTYTGDSVTVSLLQRSGRFFN